MEKNRLGARLRALRKERALTLEALAERAEIGFVYLGEIERGLKMPSLNTFIRLVNALGVSADALLYDETESGAQYQCGVLEEALRPLSPARRAAVLQIALTAAEQFAAEE